MAPSKTEPRLSPIESGTLFLDPSRKEDAVQIQTQLTKTGYYKKKIDGAFGESSKDALKNFRKNNGLGDNPTWDLSTQKMLFKNSGL